MDTPLPLAGASPFHWPAESLRGLDAESTGRILSATGDVTLVLDREGIIRDVSVGSADLGSTPFSEWVDRSWLETVTVESRSKVQDMLADASARAIPRWRQVNHDSAAGQVPVRYLALTADDNGRVIAVGRDMRAAAALQHRLLQAQQSMERDYIRLRQAESRYRLLFEISSEAVMIVDTATRRITDANPAALLLTGVQASGAGGGLPGQPPLSGQPLISVIDETDRDAVLALLGAVAQAEQTDPARLHLANGRRECFVSATLFRQDRGAYFLIRLVPVEGSAAVRSEDRLLSEVLDRMPDAFVVADDNLEILLENAAFLDLTNHARHEDVRGKALGGFLGRPGIDFNLLVGQLREHGSVRNFATISRDRLAGEEDVEVSAVCSTSQGRPHYGFSIRTVSRRLQQQPTPDRDLPRSVEQLTELVGRVSLKEIVRESTDLIERLCIEAALAFTNNNRASAAEILGLSRQSLYSKLHRHGLGNLAPDEE